jgi:exopolyphosphatase/pppGpp-phosphohydrolase
MTDTFYDPDLAPSPAIWLGMPEQERMRLAMNFHTAKRMRGHVRHHAVLHVIVENYLAQGFGPATQALAALIREGHARHEALHLIGRELEESMARSAEDPSKMQSIIAGRLLRLATQPPSTQSSQVDH